MTRKKEAKTPGIVNCNFSRQMESPFNKKQIVIIHLLNIKEAESI